MHFYRNRAIRYRAETVKRIVEILSLRDSQLATSVKVITHFHAVKEFQRCV